MIQRKKIDLDFACDVGAASAARFNAGGLKKLTKVDEVVNICFKKTPFEIRVFKLI